MCSNLVLQTSRLVGGNKRMTPGTLKVRVVGSAMADSYTVSPTIPDSGAPCNPATLSGLFKGWHLRNRAKITVNIAKTGYIG
jgi:hypothetical protein